MNYNFSKTHTGKSETSNMQTEIKTDSQGNKPIEGSILAEEQEEGLTSLFYDVSLIKSRAGK